MIKNAYNKIKKILEVGHYVRVGFGDEIKYGGSEYKRTFSSIDDDGHLRSNDHDNKKFNNLGEISWYEGEINENDIISITPLPRPIKILKVGDKVRVLEACREAGNFEDWEDDRKTMIGKVFSIEDIDDNHFGIAYSLNEDYYFVHNLVSPVFEDEKEQENINSEKSVKDIKKITETFLEDMNKIMDNGMFGKGK